MPQTAIPVAAETEVRVPDWRSRDVPPVQSPVPIPSSGQTMFASYEVQTLRQASSVIASPLEIPFVNMDEVSVPC